MGKIHPKWKSSFQNQVKRCNYIHPGPLTNIMLSAVQEKKHFDEGSDSQTTSLTRKMQLVKNEAGICEEKALPSLPL